MSANISIQWLHVAIRFRRGKLLRHNEHSNSGSREGPRATRSLHSGLFSRSLARVAVVVSVYMYGYVVFLC